MSQSLYYMCIFAVLKLIIYIDKSNDKRLHGKFFFINQIFDENIRRLHQGKEFFGKKMIITLIIYILIIYTTLIIYIINVAITFDDT